MVGYRRRRPLLHDRISTVEDRPKERQDDERLDGFHGVTTALGAALMLGPAGHKVDVPLRKKTGGGSRGHRSVGNPGVPFQTASGPETM